MDTGAALVLLALILASFSVQAFTMSMASGTQKLKLWDSPVSNNGARCRFVIYEKGIEDQVDIVSPMDVGGLKSEEYLKMNPHGKMPCMNSPECGPIPESETICHYLLDKFEGTGRSFRPSTLEERVKSAAICRLMDTYIHPVQGCMYKASPPFGIHTDRLAALEDLQASNGLLSGLASSAGPFLAGGEVSLADATVWPTMTFIREMMPRFTEGDFLGPRLMAWCHHMEQHPVGKR
ncbi:unnamed protein product [Scytosiphon promiscuus]